MNKRDDCTGNENLNLAVAFLMPFCDLLPRGSPNLTAGKTAEQNGEELATALSASQKDQCGLWKQPNNQAAIFHCSLQTDLMVEVIRGP